MQLKYTLSMKRSDCLVINNIINEDAGKHILLIINKGKLDTITYF